jgi:hypothetical protein
MTAHTESLEAGDRVKLENRTGVIELIISDIFIIKWDWRKDCGAYTRDAVEKRSLLRLDRTALCEDRLPTRLGDVQPDDLHALAACHCLVRFGTSIARSKQCAISSASVQPFGLRCRERE